MKPSPVSALALLAMYALSAQDTPPPQPKPPQATAPLDEEALRREFMTAYTQASGPQRVALVEKLRGVRQIESQRIITGLLGDPSPAVRRSACRVMAGTPDPEGYFVKPLTGALFDKDHSVKVAAVEALAHAKVKEGAAKALVYAINSAAEEPQQAPYVRTIGQALSKLTGKDFGKAESAAMLAAWWSEWWLKHKTDMELADKAYLERLAENPEEAKATPGQKEPPEKVQAASTPEPAVKEETPAKVEPPIEPVPEPHEDPDKPKAEVVE